MHTLLMCAFLQVPTNPCLPPPTSSCPTAGSPPEGTSPNTAATSSTSNTATPLPPPALSLASSSASAAAAAAGASPHNSMVRAVTTANAVSVFQRLAANSKGPGGAGGDTNLALVQQLQELKVRHASRGVYTITLKVWNLSLGLYRIGLCTHHMACRYAVKAMAKW
jgi:hypothetical protein